MEATRYKAGGPAALEGSNTGRVKAVFSTFDIVDRGGDIVRRSAFKDGQHVPLVWSHDWSRPIGRGIVRVEPTRAVFEGRFFMSTTAGREAYETVKEMAELGEWSWGFHIMKTQPNSNIKGNGHHRRRHLRSQPGAGRSEPRDLDAGGEGARCTAGRDGSHRA